MQVSSTAQQEIPPNTTNADHRQVAKVSQEFEAVLLTTFLAELEQSMGSVPGSAEDGLSSQYRSFGTEALASALSSAGGLGIGRMIAQSLERTSPSSSSGQAKPWPEKP